MMLVDGGARRHLFITELPAAAKQPGIERRLYSLVHGDLEVGCTTTTNGVLHIAGRMASVFNDQGYKDSLRLEYALASAPESRSSNKPLLSTYYAAAANAAKSCAPKRLECTAPGGTLAEDMFCNAFMNCLADRGREDGRAYGRGERKWLQFADLNLSSTPSCAASVEQSRLLSQ
jgi:hypothetical protein